MSPLSGVLSEAWTLYKRHAAHFLLISFAIYLAVAVVTALLSLALGSFGAIIGGLCFIVPGLVVILGLSVLFLSGHPPLAIRGAAATAASGSPRSRASPSSSPSCWRSCAISISACVSSLGST